MNTDICKKCKKSCYIYFYGKKYEMVCYDNFDNLYAYIASLYDNSRRNIDSCKIFEHHNYEWICTKSDNGKKYMPDNAEFNKVKINKHCPYYVEHELTEWNRVK